LLDRISPKLVERYANFREITGKALLDLQGDVKNDKFPKAEPGST
jgi:ketopantoate hydroxymethyltransferase